MAATEYFPMLDGVRALTVRQPWSWAIAAGHKLVENRSQAFSHRGALLVHAAKEWDEADVADERIAAVRFTSRPADLDGYEVVGCRWCDVELCLSRGGPAIRTWRQHHQCDRSKLTLGAVEGLVFVADCHTDGGCCRPWGESSYVEAGDGRRRMHVHHLVLEAPWALPEPIPARGLQGLWRPDAELVELVARQLLDEQRRFDTLAGSEACSACGCTDRWGCLEGCSWVHGPFDDPLCSSCT